jgi:hypothetical protein
MGPMGGSCSAVGESPLRGATVSVVRCNRFCGSVCGLPFPCILRRPLMGPSPARFPALRGFFVRASPLRCVQPTVRLGVGVVGLLFSGGIGKPG